MLKITPPMKANRMAWNLAWLTSVSYTHLDVYKRQAITFVQIVEITINGVLVGEGIVEKAIMHHHLRLHEAGLCPLERGILVARGIEANADETLRAPMRNVGQPVVMA